MAHDAAANRDQIVTTEASEAASSVVKDVGISVDAVLARLAASPDIDALVGGCPGLTRNHVGAVFAYVREQLGAAEGWAQSQRSASPQEFDARVTGRQNVADLMRRLAR